MHKNFAFVQYGSADEAQAAIKSEHMQLHGGLTINVGLANKPGSRPGGSSNAPRIDINGNDPSITPCIHFARGGWDVVLVCCLFVCFCCCYLLLVFDVGV